MVVYGPHGIFCCGYGLNLALHPTMIKADFRYLLTWFLTKVPLIADILGYTSCRSVDKLSMLKIMKRNGNFAIIPGGFQEASIFEYQKH